VINFHDWPLRRAEPSEWKTAGDSGRKELVRNGVVEPDYNGDVAADFPDMLKIVEEKVKPERTRKKADRSFALRYPLYLKWWIYAEKRPRLYSTISGMERVLVLCMVTQYLSPHFLKNNMVFDQRVVVIAWLMFHDFLMVSSNIHEIWVRTYSSMLETRLSYSITGAFETFPFPNKKQEGLERSGLRYYDQRQSIMLSRQEGLTKTYNRFHKKDEKSSDIAELRRLHVEMDYAVAAAYGWTDLELGHGFHETKQGIRYTVNEAARVEILDRLLELNFQRHDEEVKRGLTEGKKDKPKTKTKKAGAAKTLSMDFG
jgi:hypothetical protein